MINQVIPFMEFCVENDPFGESVQVSVGDFPACFVNLFDHTGTDLVLKPLSLTSCLTRWSEMSMPCFKFASYCRSFDVGPHDAFVLRISGHMLGSQLKKCLSPFRVGVGFPLCTASRLADSAALKARFVTKFMNSFDNRYCGNSQIRAQRPYRTTGVPDRFACNKMPSVAFNKSHKECFLFFCKVYWRFLLHICNILFFNYKYTKKSPVIC